MSETDLDATAAALRQSLTQHEDLADSEAAARITAAVRSRARAPRSVQRRSVLTTAAAVATIAVAGGSGVVWRWRTLPNFPSDRSGTSGATSVRIDPPAGPATTTQENLRAAAAEVERLYALAPILPGSESLPDATFPGSMGTPPEPQAGAEDLFVQRTLAYRVGLPVSRAVADLRTRTTKGLEFAGEGAYSGGNIGVDGLRTLLYWSTRENMNAYVYAGLDLAVRPAGEDCEIFVRARATARPDRDAGGYVSGTFSRIAVEHGQETGYVTNASATWTSMKPATMVTDPARILAIGNLLNGLHLAIGGAKLVRGCRPIGVHEATDFRLRFHGVQPQTVVVRAACVPEARIADGETLAVDADWPELRRLLAG